MNTQELRESYAPALRWYIAARITGPAIDDILQQVFLKIHKKTDTIRDDAAIKSWLYRTTQHTIIDRYRKHHDKNQTLVQDSFRDQQEEDLSDQKKKTILKNISSCLMPMIQDLDEKSRKVMELYIDELYTYQEIADTLWLSLANIKIIIHRSKKKLKNMYTQCCTIYTNDDGTIIDTWCRNEDCYCDNSVSYSR